MKERPARQATYTSTRRASRPARMRRAPLIAVQDVIRHDDAHAMTIRGTCTGSRSDRSSTPPDHRSQAHLQAHSGCSCSLTIRQGLIDVRRRSDNTIKPTTRDTPDRRHARAIDDNDDRRTTHHTTSQAHAGLMLGWWRHIWQRTPSRAWRYFEYMQYEPRRGAR